ncbi:MAG: HDOD domain-containing protein [Halioglobus sp.]
MNQQEQFYEEILSELKSGKLVLPVLPDVALKVNDIAESPDASITDLSEIILSDATLSAELLRVANCPLYRGRNPVDKVQTAITRLGLKMVRNLVSSLVLEQMFQAPSVSIADRLQALWQHSADVAALCHVLASKQPGIPSDEAMLAGLIHDIGVLPILLKADERPELLENPALLQSIMDDLSAPIGTAILESWDFPEGLIAAVAEHKNYQRDSVNGPDLVDIVQVANLQSAANVGQILTDEELAMVPSIIKLGVQIEVEVEEIDEDSEEYAEALALFGKAAV